MIDFPADYFEEETREGFFVGSKMKRAWAAEMEVLKEIDRICNTYGIQYFADSGTLLGAVRHKGFIPWDDDIDIAMKREDYVKFLEVAPKELPEEWILLNPFLQKEDMWRQTFTRVVNGDTISFEKRRLNNFHGCPYIVGVDIFPLDYLPEAREEEEVLWLILKYLYAAICLTKEGKIENQTEVLTEIEKICGVKIDREQGILTQLLRLADKMCCLYLNDRTERLMLSMWELEKENQCIYQSKWYEKSIRVPFENIEIPVPVGYQEVLRVLYGENYMTPVMTGARHEYPFYKHYDEQLAKMN